MLLLVALNDITEWSSHVRIQIVVKQCDILIFFNSNTNFILIELNVL